ncbi:MAG: phosphonopyruvate decarboxylase [Deltaproteobacteria bacterium]|nr:phosphonopyruvate decarboxylase [Deltaproteobacteria bacterium]
MITSNQLYQCLKKNGFVFFTGVPDSTFKDWMTFLDQNNGKGLTNIIAANECEAVALAMGYHLATGENGVVYMQNAGLGKTVNPLMSLCDPEVYSVPMLLMIGLRGEPGVKDEPQHKKMGAITLSLLDTMGIPYSFLEQANMEAVINKAAASIKRCKSAYALIIKKGIVKDEGLVVKEKTADQQGLTREDAIKSIVDVLNADAVVVSTTGKASRELFEYRVHKGQQPGDFYTVGGMGCCSSIALGIALQRTDKKVYVFDGDGAVIMQMGSLATVGHYKPKNYYHFIFDNGSYESTGGQPTVSDTLDFEEIARSCGYGHVRTVKNKNELDCLLTDLNQFPCPVLVVIRVNKISRKNLGRPTSTPVENKEKFMKNFVHV